jgi:hypothetical protein
MQDKQDKSESDQKDHAELPDEDGIVMVYGFVQIKDGISGEILVQQRF